MIHPSIPENSSDVTSEIHRFLALCRTVDKKRSQNGRGLSRFWAVFGATCDCPPSGSRSEIVCPTGRHQKRAAQFFVRGRGAIGGKNARMIFLFGPTKDLL